jgi:hypothetical protein
VRRNGLIWSDVEPNEGARNWSAVAALEAELIEAARLKFKVILIVRRTPKWAQKYPGVFCGPIRSDKMEAFGRFMGDAVTRYSAPPYNIKYWEIWNEPDSGGTDPNGDRGWGCWGEQADPYYGGRYYALALKAAYPDIKAADPGSQVVVGGLLANCDPIKPPSGRDCKQSKFLEGILVAGGAPYFDGISFHTYDCYYYPGAYGSENWHSAWNTTGPLLITKARFLRGVLGARGVTGKFMMDTELGLLCSSCHWTRRSGSAQCRPRSGGFNANGAPFTGSVGYCHAGGFRWSRPQASYPPRWCAPFLRPFLELRVNLSIHATLQYLAVVIGPPRIASRMNVLMTPSTHHQGLALSCRHHLHPFGCVILRVGMGSQRLERPDVMNLDFLMGATPLARVRQEA